MGQTDRQLNVPYRRAGRNSAYETAWQTELVRTEYGDDLVVLHDLE